MSLNETENHPPTQETENECEFVCEIVPSGPPEIEKISEETLEDESENKKNFKRLKKSCKKWKVGYFQCQRKLTKYEMMIAKYMTDIISLQTNFNALKDDHEVLLKNQSVLTLKLEQKEAELKQYKYFVEKQITKENEVNALKKELLDVTKAFKRIKKRYQYVTQVSKRKNKFIDISRRKNKKLLTKLLQFSELLISNNLLSGKQIKSFESFVETFKVSNLKSADLNEDIFLSEEEETVSPNNNFDHSSESSNLPNRTFLKMEEQKEKSSEQEQVSNACLSNQCTTSSYLMSPNKESSTDVEISSSEQKQVSNTCLSNQATTSSYLMPLNKECSTDVEISSSEQKQVSNTCLSNQPTTSSYLMSPNKESSTDVEISSSEQKQVSNTCLSNQPITISYLMSLNKECSTDVEISSSQNIHPNSEKYAKHCSSQLSFSACKAGNSLDGGIQNKSVSPDCVTDVSVNSGFSDCNSLETDIVSSDIEIIDEFPNLKEIKKLTNVRDLDSVSPISECPIKNFCKHSDNIENEIIFVYSKSSSKKSSVMLKDASASQSDTYKENNISHKTSINVNQDVECKTSDHISNSDTNLTAFALKNTKQFDKESTNKEDNNVSVCVRNHKNHEELLKYPSKSKRFKKKKSNSSESKTSSSVSNLSSDICAQKDNKHGQVNLPSNLGDPSVAYKYSSSCLTVKKSKNEQKSFINSFKSNSVSEKHPCPIKDQSSKIMCDENSASEYVEQENVDSQPFIPSSCDKKGLTDTNNLSIKANSSYLLNKSEKSEKVNKNDKSNNLSPNNLINKNKQSNVLSVSVIFSSGNVKFRNKKYLSVKESDCVISKHSREPCIKSTSSPVIHTFPKKHNEVTLSSTFESSSISGVETKNSFENKVINFDKSQNEICNLHVRHNSFQSNISEDESPLVIVDDGDDYNRNSETESNTGNDKYKGVTAVSSNSVRETSGEITKPLKTQPKKRKSSEKPNANKRMKSQSSCKKVSNSNNCTIGKALREIRQAKLEAMPDKSKYKLLRNNLINAIINPANASKTSSALYQIFSFVSSLKINPLAMYRLRRNISVFHSLIENCIVEALIRTESKKKPHLQGLITSSITTLYYLILDKKSLCKKGLGALCRVFTQLCKYTNNRQKPIRLTCDLIIEQHPFAPILIAHIIGTWVELFEPSKDRDVFRLVHLSSIYFGLQKKPETVSREDWSICTTIFHIPLAVSLPMDLQATTDIFIETMKEIVNYSPSEKDEWTCDQILIFAVTKGWNWAEEKIVGFVIDSLLYYAKNENERAFAFFAELCANVGALAPPDCLVIVETLGTLFRDEYEFDYVKKHAACNLVKLLVFKQNKDIPEAISEYIQENAQNLRATNMELYLKRRCIRDEPKLSEEDMWIA